MAKDQIQAVSRVGQDLKQTMCNGLVQYCGFITEEVSK